jgi:hypothetical protein
MIRFKGFDILMPVKLCCFFSSKRLSRSYDSGHRPFNIGLDIGLSLSRHPGHKFGELNHLT